jgi:ureidoacrylate peracid hydrolase
MDEREIMTDKKTMNINCRYYRRYPIHSPLGEIEEEISLDLDETVFLIVDVYGLGFDEDGEYGDVPEVYKEYVDIDRKIVLDFIVPTKAEAKKIGIPVIYLTNYLAPSTTENNEWRNMSIRTVGVDVLDAWKAPSEVLAFSKVIAPEKDDYLIQKQHYSGFYETQLESLLKELRARNLVVVGFDSMICLHGTVLDALYRNYRVVVLRDCVGTGEFPETREGGWANWFAIRFIESNIGYTSTAAEFLQACESIRSMG